MAVLTAEIHHQPRVKKFADRVLGSFGNVTNILKSIFADAKTIFTELTSNSSPNMSVAQTRRPICTHMTMARLYGKHKCSHCLRSSRLGWVYICTQDTRDKMTQFEDDLGDFMSNLSLEQYNEDSNASKPTQEDEQLELDGVKLKPWMEKAIHEGHYTAEQVYILKAQRQKVLDCIAEAQAVEFQKIYKRRAPVQAPSPPTSDVSPGPALIPTSVPESQAEMAVREPNPHTKAEVDQRMTLPTMLLPECRYKTCQVCRPSFHNRIWQCLDHITKDSTASETRKIADENRPISDVHLVRHMDLHKSRAQYHRPEYLPSFQANDDPAQDFYNSTGWKMQEINCANKNQNKDSIALGRLGRCDNSPRAARNLLFRPRQGSTKSKDSTDSSKDTGDSSKRSSLSGSMSNGVLTRYMKRAGTKVPELTANDATVGGYIIPAKRKKISIGQRLSKRRSVASESEGQYAEQDLTDVKIGGVAITEEAADLHTPDLILSV